MPSRALITDADAFLGPAVTERLAADGHDVVARTEAITSRADAHALVAELGPFDVVVANLDVAIAVAPVTELTEDDWQAAFGRLVDPLRWLLAACLPPMLAAGDGAVVVPTSATALRSSGHPIAAYQTARAAQVALVRSAGSEVARHGVRVNAVAPNYVENPSYYPPELVADERFQAAVRRDVPAQRLATGDEAAAVVAYLASPAASALFGAVVPIDGGWSL